MKARLYFIASLNFVLSGIGHLLSEYFSGLILPPDHYKIYKVMAAYHIHIFGFFRSMLDLMQGFSITMGFMILAYGLLNLLLLKALGEKVINSRIVVLFNVFVSVFLVVISIIYFHWPPIIFYSISAFLFLMIIFSNADTMLFSKEKY